MSRFELLFKGLSVDLPPFIPLCDQDDLSNISVFFLVPARVISVENQTVVESNEAVLVCAYEGNPTPRVIWIAPNGTEYEGSRLKLPSVSRINSGLYRCNVTNAVGSETRRAYLDVQCEFLTLHFISSAQCYGTGPKERTKNQEKGDLCRTRRRNP